jgi:hypothetical protein
VSTSLFRRCARHLIAGAACAVLTAGSASAQMERPDPAYRGLFGGDGGPTGRGLDFSASVFVGWDDNVTAGQGGGVEVGDPRFQQSSTYQGASLGLSFRTAWPRVSFGAGLNTSLRYYPELGDLTSMSHGASAGVSVRLTSRTSWNASQGVAFVPYFQLGFFPGLYLPDLAEPIALDPSLSIYRREAWTYQSATGISHRLSPRSTLTADYSYFRTDYREGALPDLGHHNAGARWSYVIGRGLSSRLGYRYARGAYGSVFDDEVSARPRDLHVIDAGLDYGGALAFGSRRTRVGFSTGSNMYTRVDEGTGAREGLQVSAVGNAYVTHRLSRTWSASASYTRGLRFVQGFREPTFQDSVVGRVGGYLGPRTSAALYTGWANGGFARSGPDARGGYDTVVAGATLQYALTRNLALYGQYGHYRYNFDEQIELPAGLTSRLQRNSVQAGLSFWLPLLR